MLFYPGEKGQSLVEYALILVLVAVVVIALMALFGQTVRDAWYQHIINAI